MALRYFIYTQLETDFKAFDENTTVKTHNRYTNQMLYFTKLIVLVHGGIKSSTKSSLACTSITMTDGLNSIVMSSAVTLRTHDMFET